MAVTQTRHVMAGHGGILAPLPGTDFRSAKPKPKSVSQFSGKLVS